MTPRKTNRIRPLATTRWLCRVFHRVFVGGSVEDLDAAISEIEDDFRVVYHKHLREGKSPRRARTIAEASLIRSLGEVVDEDTAFWLRIMLRSAAFVAELILW